MAHTSESVDAARKESPRQRYVRPTLKTYGSIIEITQANTTTGGNYDDNQKGKAPKRT